MTLASKVVARQLGLPASSSRRMRINRDVPVPMPDGVTLLADHYRPADEPGRASVNPPVLLVRSPYGRRGLFGLVFGRVLAERGFQVVVQSCRGTFGSGGVFVPQVNEKADGLATLSWIRTQPWFGGKIGMIGPSYLGYTQWAVAGDQNADLDAIVPAVTMSHFGLPTYDGGSFALGNCLEWTFLVSRQERRFVAPWTALQQARGAMGAGPVARGYKAFPLAEADRSSLGHQVDFYQDWLRYGLDDEYWKRQDHSASVADVMAPTLMVSGWYDMFLPWQLENYETLRSAGRPPRLTIGPWRHSSRKLHRTLAQQTLTFLTAHLGGQAELLTGQPVQLYVTGAETWRGFDAWPPDSVSQSWYLQADGRLSREAPTECEPDTYRYDPADPTPSLGGPRLGRDAGSVDNAMLEKRSDVLVYSSDPLAEDVEVIGTVEAVVATSSDRACFDVFVRLCDVSPEGVSRNVCDRLVRLPAESHDSAPGTVRSAALRLWPTAHRFRRGHRIRVQVSSGAHPRYARNPGTGEPLATARDLLPATQHVHHSPARPSHVVLPVRRVTGVDLAG